MTDSPKPTDQLGIMDLVDRLGYRLVKKGKHIKFSTSAESEVLREFKELAEELEYPISQAITEALSIWVEVQKKRRLG